MKINFEKKKRGEKENPRNQKETPKHHGVDLKPKIKPNRRRTKPNKTPRNNMDRLRAKKKGKKMKERNLNEKASNLFVNIPNWERIEGLGLGIIYISAKRL